MTYLKWVVDYQNDRKSEGYDSMQQFKDRVECANFVHKLIFEDKVSRRWICVEKFMCNPGTNKAYRIFHMDRDDHLFTEYMKEG